MPRPPFADISCAFLEQSALPMLWLDNQGRFLHANPTACALLGYSLDEFLKMSVFQVDPALPPDKWAEHWQDMKRLGSLTVETTHRAKDGRLMPVEVTSHFGRDQGREFNCGIIRDLSQTMRRERLRNKAQERLSGRVQESAQERDAAEQRYRLLLDGSSDAIFIHHPTPDDFPGPLVEVNQAACELLGHSREDLIGMRPEQLVDPQDADLVPDFIQTLQDEGRLVFRVDFLTKDGRRLPAELHSRILQIQGRATVVTIARDLTERLRQEQELRESEEKFRKLVDEASTDGMIIHDQGLILDVSLPFARMHGYERSELIGMQALDTIAPESRALVSAHISARSQLAYEAVCLRKDGSQFPVKINSRNILLAGKKVRAAVVRDLTGQKEAEKSLREAEERYRALFELAGDAIFILEGRGEDRGRIREANSAAAGMHGYTKDEIVGLRIQDLDASDQQELVPTHIRNALEGNWTKFETIHRKKDGSLFPVEVNAGLLPLGGKDYVLALERDISARRRAEDERRRLEMQLRQDDKMKAIGTMASGIAHDFNNILGAIIGHGELAARAVRQGDSPMGHLDKSLMACSRAEKLIRQMLSFSRTGEHEKEPVDLAQVVGEVLDMVRASLPSTIEIASDLGSGGLVLADPTQMHQMILNLCTNAGQAMGKGGRLRLSLRGLDLTAEQAAPHAGLSAGRHQELVVEDTGTGMEREVVEHIFEPFFTTKKPGMGTGMGLWMVHGIVQKAGGAVSVDSAPGRGTRFRVLLPEISGPRPPAEPPKGELPTGSERIMFIDDEPVLVDVGREVLEQLGYRVTGLTDSARALQELLADPGAYDLVVSDLTMPSPTGLELARKLRGAGLEVPVILSTGMVEALPQEEVRALGISDVVGKPVNVKRLAEAVRRALDAPRKD